MKRNIRLFISLHIYNLKGNVMKEFVICMACGYISEKSAVKDVCPACGAPAKVFGVYTSKLSDNCISIHIADPGKCSRHYRRETAQRSIGR